MTLAYSVRTTSPEQTRRVGELLGQLAEPGSVLLLAGPLGAGKTCLVQGLAQGLEWSGPVTSPTFVLMNQYAGRLMLYHIDLYRIEAEAEAFDLGLDDYFFDEGVCAVEWPERALAVMPNEYLRIDFEYLSEAERRLTFSASGERYQRMLGDLRGRLEEAGSASVEAKP